MKNFFILTESINYIEQNLCEPITRTDIAQHCYVSLSMLEKLFRYALNRSIKEYLTNRRITLAAKDILKSNLNITEIAMKYQYNSLEVFIRSFKQIWNITPSEFKKRGKFTGIHPKINYEFKEGDDFYMARKKVDLSEAYDYFREHSGTYILCFDVKNLSQINKISHKTGDLAILEMVYRINSVATDDMLVMRIGGDEFALMTGADDSKVAQDLADRVMQMNGNTFVCDGVEYPLSLWVGISLMPQSSLRYGELFTDMHKAICDSKN